MSFTRQVRATQDAAARAERICDDSLVLRTMPASQSWLSLPPMRAIAPMIAIFMRSLSALRYNERRYAASSGVLRSLLVRLEDLQAERFRCIATLEQTAETRARSRDSPRT